MGSASHDLQEHAPLRPPEKPPPPCTCLPDLAGFDGKGRFFLQFGGFRLIQVYPPPTGRRTIFTDACGERSRLVSCARAFAARGGKVLVVGCLFTEAQGPNAPTRCWRPRRCNRHRPSRTWEWRGSGGPSCETEQRPVGDRWAWYSWIDTWRANASLLRFFEGSELQKLQT